MVLCLKLVLVLTVLKKHNVFYSSKIPEIMWYEPQYNSLHFYFLIIFVMFIFMLSVLDAVTSLSLLFFMFWCIHTIFNAGKSSSSSFSQQLKSVCHISDVRSCVSSLVFLSSGPFVEVLPLSMSGTVLSIFQGRQPKYLSIWWDFYCIAWFWELFLFVGDTLF